jgi:hypothetical protein
MSRRLPTVDTPPLYMSEPDIAARVLGADAKRWPDLAAMWEREGLTPIDPLTGKRLWPAVEAFFLRRHGLTTALIPAQADGVETWGSST